MRNKTILGVLAVPTLLLLIPWWGTRTRQGFDWTPMDFAVAWCLMVGAGFAFALAATHTHNLTYRLAAALGVAGGLALAWVDLAVGIVGNEGHPANRLYSVVILVGIVGALVARLQPHGMALVLFAMASTQILVAIVAVAIWPSQVLAQPWHLIAVNAVFVIWFLTAAVLFRRAARGLDLYRERRTV